MERSITGLRAGGLISLRTLIEIRWVAICGQLVAAIAVTYGLGYEYPFTPVLAVIGVSVLLNLAATVQARGRLRLDARDAALYLAYDVTQLGVLLYLTGGLENPFAVLLLAPLTVAAIILPRRGTLAMMTLTLALIGVVSIFHHPLPGPGIAAAAEYGSNIYEIGTWIGVTLAAVFVTAYVSQVADEGRRIDDALAATQVALDRTQKLSALGALAAAAAHELGTPLGTIALVARELARELPPDSPFTEDVALLNSQVERCRAILAGLAARPETEGGEPFDRLSLPGLVEAAAEPYRRPEIELAVEAVPRDASRPPVVWRSPEMMHGLGNLLQNALQFARRRVTVRAEWSHEEVAVTIADDGTGFPPHLLNRLGEPYLSGRNATAGSDEAHMGLGIFVAATLLERGGARLRFSNARQGGAQVAIRWRRHNMEQNRS